MNMTTLNDIVNYIDFLREAGYSVVLSCFNQVLKEAMPTLLNYVPHLPMICSYLKSNPRMRKFCMLGKNKLMKNPPDKMYYACCWAGVEEFIIPVMHNDQLICCIHISGYRGKLDKSIRISQRHTKRFGTKYEDLYLFLSRDVPEKDKIDMFINPLKHMFNILYNECLVSYNQEDSSFDIYTSSIQYINDHYMENLTVNDIAKAQNYSPSYMRYIFAKHSDKTITEHLNFTRLTHAANLLKFTDISITNVAFECGFADSNYFSTAFKKYFGVPPTKYRNTAK